MLPSEEPPPPTQFRERFCTSSRRWRSFAVVQRRRNSEWVITMGRANNAGWDPDASPAGRLNPHRSNERTASACSPARPARAAFQFRDTMTGIICNGKRIHPQEPSNVPFGTPVSNEQSIHGLPLLAREPLTLPLIQMLKCEQSNSRETDDQHANASYSNQCRPFKSTAAFRRSGVFLCAPTECGLSQRQSQRSYILRSRAGLREKASDQIISAERGELPQAAE